MSRPESGSATDTVAIALQPAGFGYVKGLDAEGNFVRNLSLGEGYFGPPLWSPNGQMIAFWDGNGSLYGSNPLIRIIDEDGGELASLPTSGSEHQFSWSPDGSALVYVGPLEEAGYRVLIYRIGHGVTDLTDLTGGAHLYQAGSELDWSSKDVISFICDAEGEFYHSVFCFAGPDGSNFREAVSQTTQARGPIWSPDGQFFAYLDDCCLGFPKERIIIRPATFVGGSEDYAVATIQSQWYSKSRVNWSPSGDQIVAVDVGVNGYFGNSVFAFDPTRIGPCCNNTLERISQSFDSGVGSLISRQAISPDGTRVAITNGQTNVWSLVDWQVIAGPMLGGIASWKPAEQSAASPTPPDTPTPSATPTPTSNPTPKRAVLFITGIGSDGDCGLPTRDGGWAWLTDELKATAGMKDSDLLQYIYTREKESELVCAKGGSGSFSKIDTCWSLDDSTKDGAPLAGPGQAERIRRFLKAYLQANPGLELTIVGWSQGGVLAAYAAQKYSELAGVKNIVTLDSPLRGINSLGAEPLRIRNDCNHLDYHYDSAWDMLPSDSVIRAIDTTRRPGPNLFTVEEEGKDCWWTICIPLVDDHHSQAKWQTQHFRVHTGNHGTVWNGSGNSGETRRLRDYIVCVIMQPVEQARCSEYAKNPKRFLIKLRETAYDTITAPLNTGVLQLFVRWPGSTIETTLTSPSGRIITSSTVASDVKYEISPVTEAFYITNPEPGEWSIELYGADVEPAGEDVALTVLALPNQIADQDGDTIWDEDDNCGGVFNPSQADVDGDGFGDECDDDSDNDGVTDELDNCPFKFSPDQADENANGIGDTCDPDLQDLDGDSMLDVADNCPFVANLDQADINNDGIGDACDADAPTPTPTPTLFPDTPSPTPMPTPTPTPTGSPAVMGDGDCDGDADAVDALHILRAVAGLPESPACAVAVDVDCDGNTDAVDALFVLRHVAALPVGPFEGCPAIGQSTL